MGVIIATGFAELPDDTSAIARLRKPYSQADLVEVLTRTPGLTAREGSLRASCMFVNK
jgi:hypothetical protein